MRDSTDGVWTQGLEAQDHTPGDAGLALELLPGRAGYLRPSWVLEPGGSVTGTPSSMPQKTHMGRGIAPWF